MHLWISGLHDCLLFYGSFLRFPPSFLYLRVGSGSLPPPPLCPPFSTNRPPTFSPMPPLFFVRLLTFCHWVAARLPLKVATRPLLSPLSRGFGQLPSHERVCLLVPPSNSGQPLPLSPAPPAAYTRATCRSALAYLRRSCSGHWFAFLGLKSV
jgi:hypothetical protein